jgi:hypothetical protein
VRLGERLHAVGNYDAGGFYGTNYTLADRWTGTR